MSGLVEAASRARRVVWTALGARSLAPGVRAELAALGYALVPDGSRGRGNGDAAGRPDLRLVDDRCWDRMPPASDDGNVPAVLLTGHRASGPEAPHDARIRGTATRPAGALDLYALLQAALEEHPRRVPRVPTQLPARCIHSDRRWLGALLSLSEGGCLLRSSEEIGVGTRMNLQFALPEGRLVNTRARCIYLQDDSAGLCFTGPAATDRSAIRTYVSRQLASG